VAVDGRDAISGNEGVGEILDKAILARAPRFGNDGDGRGLEWANEGLNVGLGERAEVATLVEFGLDNVDENTCVFCC
jgi:hypothetical protein